MTMKKNIFIAIVCLLLTANVFAQRDSLVAVTTAYITPLNTGLALQDEEEEDQFVKGDPSFYKWHQAKKQIHFFVKILW
mgnify:FL=1